jgi:8-amino-7-oxononanoate synthase
MMKVKKNKGALMLSPNLEKMNTGQPGTGRREFLKTSALGLLFMNYGWNPWHDELQSTFFPDKPAQAAPFIMESAPGAETVINGRRYLYFGGTGYFGLHGNPEMIRTGIEAFKKYGMHSGTTRSGFGNNPVLLDVEKRIAEFFGGEASVYYVSGYFNNLVLAQGLADQFDVAFVDETAHFSVKDGIYTTRKPVVFFKHRDPEDLKKKLETELKPGQRPLLMTDGVFPTFGAIAPVPEYVKALEPYDGIMALDDSHAVGVLGQRGLGTYEYFGLSSSDRRYLAGTLSKAFGGHGGFIPASAKFIQHIRDGVGAYSGSSPTPTPIAAAAGKGIDLVAAHPEWRQKLWKNVALAKSGIRKLGFEMNDTPVPIVTWVMKSADEMKKVQKELLDRGIAVAYLKYVGAPAGGVLRATIFSTHSPQQINRLLEELKKLV